MVYRSESAQAILCMVIQEHTGITFTQEIKMVILLTSLVILRQQTTMVLLISQHVARCSKGILEFISIIKSNQTVTVWKRTFTTGKGAPVGRGSGC